MHTLVDGGLLCVPGQHYHLLPLLVPWFLVQHGAGIVGDAVLLVSRRADGVPCPALLRPFTPARRHGKLLAEFLIDYDYERRGPGDGPTLPPL